MAKDLLGQTVQKHVINSLKEAYGLTNIHDIPHYSIMTNKDLTSDSHRVEILVRKLSNIEKELGLSSVIWDEANKCLITNNESEISYANTMSKNYYSKILNQKTSVNTAAMQEYYNNLQTALLNPELRKLWSYDFYLENEWSNIRTSTISITYNGFDFIDANTRKVFKDSSFMNNYHIKEYKSCSSEESRFAKYAKDQITKTLDVFPVELQCKVEEKTLVLNKTFYRLQSELLFNKDIFNLYYNHHPYQKEKNLHYAENRASNNINKKYEFSNMLHCFENVLAEDSILSAVSYQIYNYLTEKLTGHLLCNTFLKYYDAIMNDLSSKQNKYEIHQRLLVLLKIFTLMPSITFRKYIIQELMEPLLYWNENLSTNLNYTIKAALNIQRALSYDYTELKLQDDSMLQKNMKKLKKRAKKMPSANHTTSIYANDDISEFSPNFKLINSYILNTFN